MVLSGVLPDLQHSLHSLHLLASHMSLVVSYEVGILFCIPVLSCRSFFGRQGRDPLLLLLFFLSESRVQALHFFDYPVP